MVGFHNVILKNIIRVKFMKKVLLISQNSLSEHANNGKTLSNIFQSWDSDYLAQLYFQDEIPESSKFNKFYRIRDVDILKKVMSPSYVPVLDIKPLPFVDNHYTGRSNFILKLINTIKKLRILKDFIRELLYSFYFLYSKELERKLIKFKPEILFFVASDYSFTIRITLKLARKFDIPIYIYILDDRFFMRKNSLLGNILNYRYLFLMKKIIKESKQCFCIGQTMAYNYSNYFEKKFNTLVNPVKVKNLIPISKIYKLGVKEYKFLYAGGMTLGRFEAILDFVKILNDVQLSRKICIEFIVCSGDFLSSQQIKELESLSIKFLGKLNNNELDEIYGKVDFVTHIESNKKENIKLTNLSISTKIPECLIKGICLVCFGPPEIASMKLVCENNIGFYVNSNLDANSNIETISNLLNSPVLCNDLTSRAKIFGKNNFTHDAVLKQLSSIINN